MGVWPAILHAWQLYQLYGGSCTSSNRFNFRMAFKEKASQKVKQFGVFVYNRRTHAIFGRTCKSWAQITTFFSLFYLVCFSIFAAHLAIFIAITPKPSEGVKPWNYGRYAYPNYPNSKIALVAVPQAFTFKDANTGIELEDADRQHINKFLQSANQSGVSGHCLESSTNFGFKTKEPCIFVHIAKAFYWTPELINATLENEAYLPIICSMDSSQDSVKMNLTAEPDGIPLNLTNNEDTKSYPFMGQSGYIVPVIALTVNLTDLPSNLPRKFEATVKCSIDYDRIGMTKPSDRMLRRLYEIPSDSTTTIKFEM